MELRGGDFAKDIADSPGGKEPQCGVPPVATHLTLSSQMDAPKRRFSPGLRRRGRLRGGAQSAPPLRAPDSAVPTTPPSNVTAAPGLSPARERAGAYQAPYPRHY
eukprot:scaffold13701_cov119-Isochrysis_galbana.AAC.1